MTPTHLIVGPASHGVTRYALELAGACGAAVIREDVFSAAEQAELPPQVDSVQVAFTDHLFGSSPAAAVDALLQYVGGRPLSVSFHDIPQSAEGRDRFARRSPAYLALARAAVSSGGAAVVNSAHEAAFFSAHAIPVTVIRLPIPTTFARSAANADPVPGTVGILGFLYPGKGHEQIIDALRGTDYRLRFLGSVSSGHEQWARSLVGSTDSTGRAPTTELTGWLSDAELATEMSRIQVPVCAHKHFSASGSLMAWLGAGRHVLVTDSRYTQEIDAWLPGRVTRVKNGAWRDAIDAFVADPPPLLEPPAYGWGDVAKQWDTVWQAMTR